MRSRASRGRALRVDAGGGHLDVRDPDQAEGIEDSRPAISEFLRFLEQLKDWVDAPPVTPRRRRVVQPVLRNPARGIRRSKAVASSQGQKERRT
jgi:hypothetical protein